jgi:hypothetical protein
VGKEAAKDTIKYESDNGQEQLNDAQQQLDDAKAQAQVGIELVIHYPPY